MLGPGGMRGRGEEERAARGGNRRVRAVGCWAELDQKQRREKNSFSFSFHSIFQKILNPLLNLNQTTQYKNSNATA
jgi:hypothetical protein